MPPVPILNRPAFSRKKSRFSGKNRLKRVRFTCCSSTSTCAKSVLKVTSRFMPPVTPYFASRPTSRRNDVVCERCAGCRLADAADDERLELEVEAVAERLEPDEAAGQADAREAVRLRDRRPEHLLVLAADVPHEIDAPRLLVARR